MECRVCTESLSALLDGELSDAQRQAVDGHLQRCTACRDELESLRFSTRLTDRLESLEVSPDLWSRIEARLDPETVPAREPASILPFRRYFLPAAAAVAAALALAVGLPLFFEPSYPEPFEAFLQEREARYQQRMQALPATEFDFDGGTFNPFRPVAHGGANPFR